MNTLTLRIKREYFDAILNGSKKVEYREVRPSNVTRHVYFIHKGISYKRQADIPEDNCGVLVKPIEYDVLRLINGYATNAPELIIEVVKTYFYFLTDNDCNDIVLEQNGIEYYASIIEYHLGKVLSTKNV